MSRPHCKSSLLSLSIATCMSLTATANSAHAAAPQYSLTIYSSAQPGQLSPEALQTMDRRCRDTAWCAIDAC